jgi:hypothetical protein
MVQIWLAETKIPELVARGSSKKNCPTCPSIIPLFSVWGDCMVKKVQIIVRLLPEASKLSDEELIKEIEEEIKKAIYTIPWANSVESVEIQEANQTE